MDPTDWQYTHQRQWKSPRRRTDSRDLSGKVDVYSVRNTLPFMNTGEKDVGFPSSTKWSSAYNNNNNNRPLKERVNGIMQRRWPDGQWRKATTAFSTPTDHLPPPVEKTSSSTLNKDDHPLKLRVKALMNRHRHSGLLESHGEIPVKPQPPSQSPTTTVEENNSTVKGFQRFLSVLNKGVDIEMLNRIVIDDDEHTGQDLLHSSQTPVVKEKSVVCESDSQRLQCGAGQKDRRSASAERTTELINQHISNEACKRNIQREEKSAQSDNGGDCHFGSSRRSMSPPVVEAKKPKLEQHQGDLQNILKTIGFNMDADDMCKLAERTQKRLYGMKNETELRADATALSKRSQQHVRSDHSRSSSSTSVSDRPSSSPSCHQHSPSKTSRDSGEQTQCSEYLHFNQAGVERTPSNSDLSLSEGQTGQQSAVNTVTKAEQKEGQIESPFSWLNEQLKYVREQTETHAKCNPKRHCEWIHQELHYILNRLEQSSHILSEGQIRQQFAVNTVTNAEFQMEEKKMAEQKESPISFRILLLEVEFIRCLLPLGIELNLSSLNKELRYVRIALANCDLPKHNPEWLPEWLRKELAAKEQYILMILNPNADGQTGQKSAVNTVTKAEQKEGQKESQRSIQGQQLEGHLECTESHTSGFIPVGKVSPFSWLKEQLKYVRKQTETQARCNRRRNSEWLRKQLAAKEQYILKILRPVTE